VHQLGLHDRVEKRGDSHSAKHPARQLLGLTQIEVELIGEMALCHIAK